MANPAFVQSNSSDTNAFSSVRQATFTGAQTLGNANVVHVAITGSSGTVQTIGDTSGNVYALIKNSPLTTVSNLYTYVATNIVSSPAGINTVTVTLQTGVTSWAIAIVEYNNVAAASLIDGSSLGTGASAGPALSGSVTTTYAADILVSCAFCLSGAPTGPGAGFTQRVLTPNNDLLAQDRLVTSTGTYTATAPLTGTTDWNIILVALKGTAIVQKPLTGTCTGKGQHTGTVRQVNALAGSVTTQSTSTGAMNAAKPLAGTCTGRSLSVTDLFVIKNLFGICTGRAVSTGQLTVKRPLAGSCTVTSPNTGNLTRTGALLGGCTAKVVANGYLSLQNQLLGECDVYVIGTDNFVVGERGICTVTMASYGELFVTNVLEVYAVVAADSSGALVMTNALSGSCEVQTDMVGLLDPPQNWFVKATGGAVDNGTNGNSWQNAWSVGGIGWNRVLASDTVWFGGGTYSAELSVPKSGALNNPISFRRVLASDPATVTTGVAGWVSTLDAQIIMPGISVNNSNSWLTFDGRTRGTFSGSVNTGWQINVGTGGGRGVSVGFGSGGGGQTMANLQFYFISVIGPQPTPVNDANTITGSMHGFDMAGSNSTYTNILINNCVSRGTNELFRGFGWNRVTIEYCYMSDSVFTSGDHDDTIYSYPPNKTTWRYNTICNSWSDGFFSEFTDFGGNMQGWYFYGNAVYNFGGAWVIVHKGRQSDTSATGPIGPAYIYNNAFVNCDGSLSWNGSTLQAQCYLYNNLFWNSDSNSMTASQGPSGGIPAYTGTAPISDYNAYNIGLPTGEPHSITIGTNPFVAVPATGGIPGRVIQPWGTAGDLHLTAAGKVALLHGITNPPDPLGQIVNKDVDGNTRGSSGTWMIGPYDVASTSSRPLVGTCTVRGNHTGTLTPVRKLVGTAIARGNSLATLRATKKPVGTCTVRANSSGTISTPSINHLAGSCQARMISSGAALKTSTGASWDDLVAAWDSGTVTWNDVFASVTLSGTCTARSGNVSDSITVTKRVTGIATARAASSGTLTVFRLFGVCTARAVNTGVVRATKRLVGTDTVRGINAGDIDSFRVLAGACEVDAAHTGALRATKRLVGSCVARNGNVNDPLTVTRPVTGTCTARANNSGTIKVSKPLSGTCTVLATSFGDLNILFKLTGVCTARANNSGALRVVRPLAGTDTVRAINTGTLKSLRVLTGTCTVTADNSGDFTATKRLVGPCTVTVVNTGLLRATKRILGPCTARANNAGALLVTRFLSGTCQARGANTGILNVARFAGSCVVRSTNTGVLLITRRLTGTATAKAINTGAFNSGRILLGNCTAQSVNTGTIRVTRRLAGPCTVISPVASTTITVVKTVFGICTVRAVNTGTILVTKRATGVCTVRAANTGGLSVSRFRGTCTARTLNSGTIKVTRFIAGASTAIATNTGTLKSFRIMAGTATGRTANAGSLTIPFSPVALVGTDTVRTLNAGTLKVTKPLIGESMLPISVVQFAGGFNAGLHSSFLVVFATNPVPGNLILTLVEWKTTGSPTVTASGGATNIWTQIGPTFDGSGGESQAVFACIAKPTGMTMFINFSAPVTDIAMDIAEYRNTSNVIDDISNGSSLTGSIDTGIISTTFANDLLIAFQKANSAVTVTSPGWTTRGTGGANFFGFAERIPRVLGTYNYTGTATTPWTASIYGIKGNAYGVAKANNAGALTSSRPLSGTCTVRGVNTGDLFVTRILAGTATVRGINLGTLTVVFNVNALAGICTVRGTNTGALRATKLLTGVCTARGINTGSLNVSRFAGACTVRGVNTGIMRASKPLAGACTGRGSNTGVLRATKAVAGTSTVLGINTGSLFVGGVALFVSGTCTVRTANTGKLLIQKPLTGLCTVRGVNVGAINSLKILSGIDTVRANSFGNLSMLSRFRGTATVRAQNTGVLRSNKRLTGICTVRTVSGGELDARRGPTYTMHFSIKVNNYKGKLHLLS